MSQFTPPPLPHNARSARSVVPVSLLTGVALGAVLWLVGEAVFYGGVLGGMTPHPGRWILWFQAAGEIGQALCVGSAAILIGLLVVRRWNTPR